MKAIIFDMDGLMIDSERLYIQSEREIAGRFNANLKVETLGKMMGRKPIESIRIFIEDLKLPADEQEILAIRDEMMKHKLQTDLLAMPGLNEIITHFKNKLKLAVCTGAPGEFLEIVLNILDLGEVFDVCQTSDDIKKGKPHPEIYLKTCQRLKLNPKDCVVLEDSENGVKAGKSAYCYTIAVPSDYTREQDFSDADFIADNLLIAQKHIDCLLKDGQRR